MSEQMSTSASGLHPDVRIECPECGARADAADLWIYQGCPACARAGRAVNMVASLPPDQVADGLRAALDAPATAGLWRWADVLPVGRTDAVSLGEGNTPLLSLPRLAAEHRVGSLLLKHEAVNPTWSHKDRVASLTVSAAKALGADTVVLASTGNHGAAVAAYAARAGLRCVIYTLTSVPETMRTLMRVYGATVVAVDESAERYTRMAEDVKRHGWFPASNGVVPPVGTHPLGTTGYRTIAYEIFDQLGGQAPDVVVAPVAYGDCLAGMWAGFRDLHDADLTTRLPRLVGADVLGALSTAYRTGSLGPVPAQHTAAFSIAGTYSTHQAVRAIEESGGATRQISEESLSEIQLALPRSEGLFLEAASAVAVSAALTGAGEGLIGPADHVVVIGTSSGLKDPGSTAALLEQLPLASNGGH